MAGAHLIEPFPADIDRNHFGHYLSGFTDGEGCFQLRLCGSLSPGRGVNKVPSAVFHIRLRADDLPVLRMIRSYLGCGTFNFKRAWRNQGPQVCYTVCGIKNLLSVVIPQFEQYPLRAKKARDFQVWCEGVRLIKEITSRPRTPARHGRGTSLRWTPEPMAQFLALKENLAAGRGFNATVAPPPPAPVTREPSLFDALED
jgi:hypothetical protein